MSLSAQDRRDVRQAVLASMARKVASGADASALAALLATLDVARAREVEELSASDGERTHPDTSPASYLDADHDGHGATGLLRRPSMRCARETWETESVWLTREEAEAYGNRRSYNYRDGWRVFCVCAEGELRGVLDAGGS